MANTSRSETYIGEAGLYQLIELVIAELEKKQDQMYEVSAERIQQIWDETEPE